MNWINLIAEDPQYPTIIKHKFYSLIILFIGKRVLIYFPKQVFIK